VLEIDKSLNEAYRNIPQTMKAHGDRGDLHPPPSKSDWSYMQLEFMYHGGMCTLHRRYIAKSRLHTRYNLSRERCISSALTLLSYQHFLEPYWYKISSTRQILTLPAMILFLELEHRRKDPVKDTSSDSGALLQALVTSCALWEDAKGSCDEAGRVHQILAGMLSSFQIGVGTSSSQTQMSKPVFEFSGTSPQFPPLTSDEMVLDWATWDAFIEGASFEEGVAA